MLWQAVVLTASRKKREEMQAADVACGQHNMAGFTELTLQSGVT